MEDENDLPQLPADTLQLLKDFQKEKDERSKKFEDLKTQAEDRFRQQDGKLSMDLFSEDWNASQFWYTDETAGLLARRLLDGASSSTVIAVVSAPSVYIQLRNILSERVDNERPTIRLLEYDKRFEVLGEDFVFYDFQQPLRLPAELKGSCQHIICDPPFLSDDCQTKTALTVRFLAKNWAAEAVKVISCTGERMERLIGKLYVSIGVKTTTFEPEHSKGLSNEFRCYANFECDEWRYRGSRA